MQGGQGNFSPCKVEEKVGRARTYLVMTYECPMMLRK